MLWADSTDIGCAATFYSTNTSSTKMWYNIVFVCNYGPGGNYIGLPMYEAGKPCSKCPKGLKQNVKYKGLCGESPRVDKSINEDKENIFQLWYNMKNNEF